MIALLAGLTMAYAQEYRQLELADGRSLRGQIVAQTGDGLDLELPQGRTHLAYEEVLNIVPLDPAVYHAQAPWRVLLLPTLPDSDAAGAVDAQLLAELGAMRGVVTITTPSHEVAMCAGDLTCVEQRLLPGEADIAVLPAIQGGNTLVIATAWTGAPDVALRGAVPYPTDPSALRLAVSMAVHQGLGLVPPPSPLAPMPEPVAPVEPAWGVAAPSPTTPSPTTPSPTTPSPTTPSPTTPSPATTGGPVVSGATAKASPSPALAWVPIPGFPQWVAGESGKGAAATAVVIPATAAIVYVSGGVSTRPAEHYLLSGLGYYAACVMANRAFLPVVAPVEGGAKIGVVGSF